MSFSVWALIIGALLTTAALSGTLLKRLPLSITMFYLVAGYALGPGGLDLISIHPIKHAVLLERLAEVAVLISLFAVGLKLGLPLSNKAWHMPLRLAVISMTLTIAMISLVGMALGLPVGAAILLGAILAPTDPVLASDIQVIEAGDRDRLRFCLSGEGALNDGAAFPFVMLGMGLLGLHELGAWGWRWFALDVLWSIAGGLLIGGALGASIGRLVVYLRSCHKESIGLDEFLALGLIAFTYGLAVISHASGFLAVFAAGLALQRVGKSTQKIPATAVGTAGLLSKKEEEKLATHSDYASAYLMHEVQGFNERLERIAEVALVLIIGAMLSDTYFSGTAVWVLLLLFLVVRPLSVWLGLMGSPISGDQRTLISWFGIRGIGSIYYVMYAINHGLPHALAEDIMGYTLIIVATSIVLHGISVTPLMSRYGRRKARRAAPANTSDV
jgi:NhaP-type Na+/H+ or K+/H+ antiporter